MLPEIEREASILFSPGLICSSPEPNTELLARLERYVAPWFPPKNALNRRRCEILSACRERGRRDAQGLFTLTVPTGGGKTVASLAFALEHAVAAGMQRIIYVVPYTSIIEQTADVFREIHCVQHAGRGERRSHPTRGGWVEMAMDFRKSFPYAASTQTGQSPSIVYSKNPCGVLHHRGHFLPISLQKSPSNAPKGTSALPAHKAPPHILHASPVGFRYTAPAAALPPWERAAACHPALSPFGECAALPASW